MDGLVIGFRNQQAPVKTSKPIAHRIPESGSIEMTVLMFGRDESANEIGDFIGSAIQSEVPNIKTQNWVLGTSRRYASGLESSNDPQRTIM
jgi:hypothetical protein